MEKTNIVSIMDTLAGVPFLPDRKPVLGGGSTAFAQLADYRNGGIWVGHYAGDSEWERHPEGDELVQIMDGETTLTLLIDQEEVHKTIKKGELIVVPQGIWHRFTTPTAVTVMTITPQPSDHQETRPSD